MKGFYSFIRGVFWLPFKILFPTRVVNREAMPEHNRLITVSNHLSWMDIPVLAVNVKGYRHFLAKKEIGKSKFIHSAALKMGVIFIDRGNSDLSAIRNCVNALKAQESLSIFPEGTRNKTGEDMGDIKAGVCMLALKGDAAIVPALLYRKPRVFRKNYLMIGEPFNLDEFKGQLLSAEVMDKASAIVVEKMQDVRVRLIDYVENKRWKEIKAAKRVERIEFKKKTKIVTKSSKRLLADLKKRKYADTAVQQ